jgi:hypothetical protein
VEGDYFMTDLLKFYMLLAVTIVVISAFGMLVYSLFLWDYKIIAVVVLCIGIYSLWQFVGGALRALGNK